MQARLTSPLQFVPWMLLVGLLVPIPTWILHRRWPKFGWNAVFTPTLVAELGFYSVGINSGTFMSFVLAIVSQWYLRKWVIVSPFLWSLLTYPLRYRPRWFRKYNFLLSAALDGGTQVMVFVYSFAVGGASGTATPMPNWALVSSEIELSTSQSPLTLRKPHRTQPETQIIAIVSPVNILLDIIVTRSERNTILGTITSTISTQLKMLSTSYLKGSWLKYTFLFVVNLALSSFSLLSTAVPFPYST